MAYIDTKDIYDLFENGVANLHVTDIDVLPRIEPKVNAYKCTAVFDNGATVEDKVVIAFASDNGYVPHIVDKTLCKCHDDYIRSMKIEKIDIKTGTAFIVVDN